MDAASVMTRDVVTIDADQDVVSVARLLLQLRISAVPVLDGDGNLIGIVSEGDLLRRREIDTDRRSAGWKGLFADDANLASDYAKSHARRASDIMTRNVVTVPEEMPLAGIADLFERHNIKRVPVVRDNRVVGIVSRADLLRALVAVAELPQARATPSREDGEVLFDLQRDLGRQQWARSSNVHVTVEDGVVVLFGTVASEAERTAIRVAAEAIPGVKAVQDRTTSHPSRAGM
jgi:CBS domain-containing protein